jgi:tRNA pseudouridine38-40 synthase
MKQATLLLPRYNDYGGLCKTPADNRTTVCQVTTATLYSDTRGDRLRFQISANRFLGKMVRIIVGKLLDIGRGEITVDEFEQALITRKTPKTIEPAYPQGLYLSNVQYPYLRISPRTEFSAIHQDLINSWKPI